MCRSQESGNQVRHRAHLGTPLLTTLSPRSVWPLSSSPLYPKHLRHMVGMQWIACRVGMREGWMGGMLDGMMQDYVYSGT